MKYHEVTALSVNEQKDKLKELFDTLLKVRLKKVTGENINFKAMSKIKRDIARVKTAINNKDSIKPDSIIEKSVVAKK